MGPASIVTPQFWLRTAPVEDLREEVMHFWVGARHITITLLDDLIVLCSIPVYKPTLDRSNSKCTVLSPSPPTIKPESQSCLPPWSSQCIAKTMGQSVIYT